MNDKPHLSALELLRNYLLQFIIEFLRAYIVEFHDNRLIEDCRFQMLWEVRIIGKPDGVFFRSKDNLVVPFHLIKAAFYFLYVLAGEIMMVREYLYLYSRRIAFNHLDKRFRIGDTRYYKHGIVLVHPLQCRDIDGLFGEYRFKGRLCIPREEQFLIGAQLQIVVKNPVFQRFYPLRTFGYHYKICAID